MRVATVTRISTDETNQPYSLDAQANGLAAFVASQPGHVITHRFVDQASGATLERPGLQAGLAAARAGEFDVLLVYRIDRLTRSIVGLMSIVEDLAASGVALRSATEPIDTNGPVGRMLLQLLGIFAEFERGLLIDRISKGFERKAARGEWLGGPGPYGYTLDSASKTLIPEPAESTVVRAIFAKYVDERLGASALAGWLNDTGRRSRLGGLWSNQTVLRVLRNPVYLGKIAHGDQLYDAKHDPIIDTHLHARVQALLDERAAASAMTAPSASEYLLTGKLRCTACHGAYVGAGAHGRGGYYRYYVCRTRQAKGTHGCHGPRIVADQLETAVLDALVATYAATDLLLEAAQQALDAVMDERPHVEAEIASLDTQLHETNAAISRYLRAFEAGTMSDTLCAPRIAELSQRRDELDAHRAHLARRADNAEPAVPTIQQLRAVAKQLQRAIDGANPGVTKQVLDELIDRVEISPDKHAQPYFRIPGNTKPRPTKAGLA
ncbi:MAG: recombinase family protein [Acidimicrobiales bacterium]